MQGSASLIELGFGQVGLLCSSLTSAKSSFECKIPFAYDKAGFGAELRAAAGQRAVMQLAVLLVLLVSPWAVRCQQDEAPCPACAVYARPET